MIGTCEPIATHTRALWLDMANIQRDAIEARCIWRGIDRKRRVKSPSHLKGWATRRAGR